MVALAGCPLEHEPVVDDPEPAERVRPRVEVIEVAECAELRADCEEWCDGVQDVYGDCYDTCAAEEAECRGDV